MVQVKFSMSGASLLWSDKMLWVKDRQSTSCLPMYINHCHQIWVWIGGEVRVLVNVLVNESLEKKVP